MLLKRHISMAGITRMEVILANVSKSRIKN
jgi:hypothetical protein